LRSANPNLADRPDFTFKLKKVGDQKNTVCLSRPLCYNFVLKTLICEKEQEVYQEAIQKGGN